MAFLDLREALLADENGVFGVRRIELRIKPVAVFVMNHLDGFYAAARKDNFSAKKGVKKYFNYFSNDEGGEQLR